jgi:ArsR family transcriptional regulator
MKTELEITNPDLVCCPPLLEEPISTSEAEVAARVFKALSDPARVRLLSIVASSADQEACVCDLLPGMDLSQPTVSHHLKVLHEAGILDRERRGSWVYYRIRPEALTAISKAVAP